MTYNESINNIYLKMKVNKDYIVLQEVKNSMSDNIISISQEYEVLLGGENVGTKAKFDESKAKKIVVQGKDYIVVKNEDIYLYY